MADYDKTEFKRRTTELTNPQLNQKWASPHNKLDIESTTSGPLKSTTSEPVSLKHDEEKPALQYVPREAMEAMGKAFGYGAKKYGGENYKFSGLEVKRCLGAALRHIYESLDGVDLDHESGQPVLGHAMAALAMAIYMQKNFPEKDDRFKKVK